MSTPLVFGVSDFVAVFNQTIDFAFPQAVIEGELSELRISRNTWAYFNLKDEHSSVKFFCSTSKLPGPLEEGMMLRVSGVPQLHHKYGFSIQVQAIQLAGKGTIKKAAKILEQKLEKEGLFLAERKRALPHPPKTIGLITSVESAAYSDFIKIINERWAGVTINVIDVQVQGINSAKQIISAISFLNKQSTPADVISLIRGGGSVEDLQTFNDENVTRSVASSRIPTIVAIGHERDISLAEKAADLRASTPSNAAELLVPDKKDEKKQLDQKHSELYESIKRVIGQQAEFLSVKAEQLNVELADIFQSQQTDLLAKKRLISSINPQNILKRGYAIVRRDNQVIRSAKTVKPKDKVSIEFFDSQTKATIN